jgi:hypothetical protein
MIGAAFARASRPVGQARNSVRARLGKHFLDWDGTKELDAPFATGQSECIAVGGEGGGSKEILPGGKGEQRGRV